MEQLEFFPLESPCVGVCELNNKGYCKGCLRSREDEAARRKAMEGEPPEAPVQPDLDF